MTQDVAKQSHYTECAIQPIEYMKATMTPSEFEGYLRGNIIKYISRYKHKNGIEDLKKAQVYLGWLIEHIDEDNMERYSSFFLSRGGYIIP